MVDYISQSTQGIWPDLKLFEGRNLLFQSNHWRFTRIYGYLQINNATLIEIQRDIFWTIFSKDHPERVKRLILTEALDYLKNQWEPYLKRGDKIYKKKLKKYFMIQKLPQTNWLTKF